MVGQFKVLDETPDEYTGKKGLVKSQVLTLVDDEKTPGGRLKQMLEYRLTEEEKVLYAGKLADRVIVFALTELEVWGGRFRCRGKILDVPGLNGHTASAAAPVVKK